MPDTTRRLIPRAALAALLLVASVPPAHAQTTPAIAPAPATPDFMSRYDFHLSAAAVSINDPRFSWETHFGGDIDVFDYVVGRSSILIDYEAVLGDEFRPFDPNQGNYTLEASSSARVGETEIAVAFHHVSRHLSDRPKRFAIAWNILGVRVLRRVTINGFTIDGVATAGKVVQNSFVDYTWAGDLDLMIRRPVSPRLGVFAHGFGNGYLVDQTIAHRDHQLGGNVEVGLRINGRAGAVELFAGAETRIDADPIDRIARRWALAGFRLVSK
ncbi:MAG TPA: hypothetical protein VGJ29_14620 [Vicinamibacterales bacterium]|jgi:hypothetical protein